MRYIGAAFLILLSTVSISRGEPAVDPLDGVASTDPATVQRSIETLRKAGPPGLNAMINKYYGSTDPKIVAAIDAVAAQRGAAVSRLYWYTDLAEAEAAAEKAHKPILYLRLMGKLTDEYSCANSRFFRTVLYSNAGVSEMLRSRFILVWVSERPVPMVTIDYGDGRLLKRTLTGNSIHYVLDSSGRVVDALPGLFDPATFSSIVSQAGSAATGNPSAVSRHIESARNQLLRGWNRDLELAHLQPIVPNDAADKAAMDHDAHAAMQRTISKRIVEQPLLQQIAPQFAEAIGTSIDDADADTWRQLAKLHMQNPSLDAQSIAVIRSQNPTLYADPAALEKTVRQFEQSIAEDSVRDNFLMRGKVLSWLSSSNGSVALDDLNQRVYTDLFLTPRNDPWLGLLPEATYSALTDDGRCSVQP